MANLVFDFLHSYETGERRESEPANAYQYDEGHVLEAVLPEAVTSCEIHYWIRGQEKSEAYTPGSIVQNDDGSCTVTGNIPNTYFETNGELRVYIVVTDGDASITTYEGYVHICQRSMPDDYVDDDPENEATRVLIEAQTAAATATAAAETCEEVRESIPEDYSQLSEDVDTLKDGLSDMDDRVTALEEGGGSSGLTNEIRLALLQIASKVAYKDNNGQIYYDDLYDALYAPIPATSISLSPSSLSFGTTGVSQTLVATLLPRDTTDTVAWSSSDTSVATVSQSGVVTSVAVGNATITATAGNVAATCSVEVVQASLESISATYTQSGTVYNTDSLDTLESDLIVVAYWDNSTTSIVASNDYTLSGTLTVGTSTILVSYGGKTDTFDVTVSYADPRPLIHKWDFTRSLVDEKSSLTFSLINSNSNPSSVPTRDTTGLHFTEVEQVAFCDNYTGSTLSDGSDLEIDFGDIQFTGTENKHKRLLMANNADGLLIFRNAQALQIYKGAWFTYTAESGQTIPASIDLLANKTVKLHFGTDLTLSLYIDNVLIGTRSGWTNSRYVSISNLAIGGRQSDVATEGNQICNCTVTGLRIYGAEEGD